jgi:hypothetical protein
MRKALVVCYGYLGDHLFASSIAKKLLEEKQFDMVDYVVGFPQVIPLLKLNPFIHEVFYEGIPTPSPRVLFNNGYDKIIQLGPLSFVEPPCVEFQKLAGIRNPTPDFQVYTDSTVDEMVKDHFKTITDVPIVAVMSNWEPKTFRFTKEQYEAGIDVPNKGYGGSWRNIKYIVEQLEKHFVLVWVGAPANVTQFETVVETPQTRTLLGEASILKHCDFFVGAEGGMANLAFGVGCKTILTSDFVHQLYGWNGVIRKIPEPKLGPRFYFPTGHIDLDPYLTDEEVATQMIDIIKRSYNNE